MEEDNEETVEIELQVVKSKIKTPGGIARVNSDVLPKLAVEKGENIEVKYGEKAILVRITEDPLMEMGSISLREPDMKKLDVEEGDLVTLKAHTSIGDVLGEWKEKIVKKFKKDDEEEEGE